MSKKYNPHSVEAKWREKWPKERESYKLEDGDIPYYVLDMISYPSSEGLHMGHWLPYTIADVWARYNTLLGKKVLSPVGFDAFGLPAENAAIKTGTHPAVYTKKSMANFSRQIQEMGKMYDWSTLINTSDPNYYKWTQWLFVQLYNNGLAYRKSGLVNWCPSCQTVLANEQVENGRCERCKSEVVKKELKQWYLKITDFADDLLNFDGLQWPESVKTLQKNWIGKSEGAEIDFTFDGGNAPLTVYTTRPDTLFGVTYVVISPEHHDLDIFVTDENRAAVDAYVTEAQKKTEIERLSDDKEKTGVFTGSYVDHPLTGEKIPVWVADYVLATYGTGAVMAVPAHDERDYAFAQKYDLPIRQVIEPVYWQTTEPGKVREGEPFDDRAAIIALVKHWSEDKYIALKWKKVAWGTLVTGGIEEGQTAEEAAQAEIREETGYINAKPVANYGMVHGLFYHVPKKTNRAAHAQVIYLELENDEREPIDETEEAIHEIMWLTQDELKGFLTPDTHQHSLRWHQGNVLYTGEGIAMNSGDFNGLDTQEAKKAIVAALEAKGVGRHKTQYRLRDWLVSRQRYWGAPIPILYCDSCGEQAVPEDHLPVLLPEDAEFLPTGGSPLERHPSFKHATCPKCGGNATRETDTLDTFVDSSWYFLRYLSPTATDKPFDREQIKQWMPVDFYVGGTEHSILHLLYARFMTKALHRLDFIDYAEPFQQFYGNGMVFMNGSKMSKSKGNVVNPDDMVKQYGTDALRGYMMFMGPADQDIEWQANGINGISRFLQRAWQMFMATDKTNASTDIRLPIQKAYQNVSDLLAAQQFNRVISTLMIAFNESEGQNLTKAEAEVLVRLLAPFFPHFAEEVWESLGHTDSIFVAGWPNVEVNLAEDVITYVVQINGKKRGEVEALASMTEEEVISKVKQAESVSAYLDGKTIQKTIFVPGRIVNFVVE